MPPYSHLHTEDHKERDQPHRVDVKVKFVNVRNAVRMVSDTNKALSTYCSWF